MAFTKQHFDYLAASISSMGDHFKSNRHHAWFAADMADQLSLVNPRMRRDLFIMACMPNVYEGTRAEEPWQAFARRAETPANLRK